MALGGRLWLQCVANNYYVSTEGRHKLVMTLQVLETTKLKVCLVKQFYILCMCRNVPIRKKEPNT